MRIENLSGHTILKIGQVLELTQSSRSKFWRDRKMGRAPKCLMQGDRVLGVTVADFLAWQESLREGGK